MCKDCVRNCKGRVEEGCPLFWAWEAYQPEPETYGEPEEDLSEQVFGPLNFVR